MFYPGSVIWIEPYGWSLKPEAVYSGKLSSPDNFKTITKAFSLYSIRITAKLETTDLYRVSKALRKTVRNFD